MIWIQVLTTAYRRRGVRLVSGRMSRRVPSAAAAGAVCRRGPVRLLTGPWDAAAGIARHRAGGLPPPRQGPPASRRTSRRGAAAAAACPGRWRGGDSPLTRSSGIVRRTDVGEGLTLALGHGHLSNNGLHINNLTVNTSTNNHVVSQLCDCAQHCA